MKLRLGTRLGGRGRVVRAYDGNISSSVGEYCRLFAGFIRGTRDRTRRIGTAENFVAAAVIIASYRARIAGREVVALDDRVTFDTERYRIKQKKGKT